MVRRSLLIVLALTIVLAGAQAALALIAPVKIFDPPGSQFAPYRNAAWLLYESNSKEHPSHSDALARPVAGGQPTKMNAKGTEGYPGGVDPGTNSVIYTEYTNRDSNIRLFNLDTMQRESTPRAMHTQAPEFDAHISASYMSFFKWQRVSGTSTWYANLYLLRRSDHHLTKIASIKGPRKRQYFFNDYLGEHYATWTICVPATCTVRVYTIDSPGITELPSTSDNKPQYASTIDETAGVLFFVRSGFGCGVGVNIWSVPLADLSAAPTKLGSIPKGQDVANSMSLDAGDLLFAKYSCSGGSGIYALPGADT